MTIPQDHRSFHIQQRFIELYNVGSGTIPAYGACEVMGVVRPEEGSAQTPGGGRVVWQVQVPSAAIECNWIVNSHCPIAPGEYGKAGTKDSPMLALVASDVHQGDGCGIAAGTCILQKGYCGFVCDEEPASGVAQVTRIDNCDNQQTVWMKAYDCILPGSTTGTAIRQRKKSGGGYEDDPKYLTPITIDNSMCQIVATPGDMFQATISQYCGEEAKSPEPIGQWGLNRPAVVKSCVACGDTGTATLLKTNTDSGSGLESSGCAKDETGCDVTFTNNYGRPIGCIGHERIELAVTPGDCCFRVVSTQNIPTRIQATLTTNTCEDEIKISGVTWKGGCDDPITPYTKPTKVENPLNIPGCLGQKIFAEIAWTDCDCKWEIIQIQPKLKKVLFDLQMGCKSTTCTLDIKEYEDIAIWSCNETVCSDSATWKTKATGDLVEFTADVSCGSSNGGGCGTVNVTTKKGCMWCVTTVGTSAVLTIESIDYASGFSQDARGTGSGGHMTCGVSATMARKCVVTCGTPSSQPASATVISGESVIVVESVDFNGCPSTQVIEIVALCVASSSSTGTTASCTTCGGSGA